MNEQNEDFRMRITRRLNVFFDSPWVTTSDVFSRERLRVIGICTLIFVLSYALPNRFHVFSPTLLRMTELDQVLPFTVESVWVYVSAYLMIYLTFFFTHEVERANRLVWSFLTLTFMGAIVFWLFPTTYPRSYFPIPEGTVGLSVFVLGQLRGVDLPANCLPSLHVAFAFLCAFVFLPDRRRFFAAWFVWAVAIWISTMTTKQHYFIDGLFGFLLAYIVQRGWQKRLANLRS